MTELFSSQNPEHYNALKAELVKAGVLPNHVPIASQAKEFLENCPMEAWKGRLQNFLTAWYAERDRNNQAQQAFNNQQAELAQQKQTLPSAEPPPAYAGGLGSRRGKQRRGWLCCTHGNKKVGKSTWAALAPRAIFADLEGGLVNIDCTSDPVSDWQKLLQYVETFARQSEFQTLVIDTLDVAEKKLWQHLIKVNKWKTLETPGYQRGQNDAAEELFKLIFRMREISETGKNFLWIAHSKVKSVLSPEGETYDWHGCGLEAKAQEVFFGQMDALFYAHFDTSVRKNAGGDIVAGTSGQRLLTVADSLSAMVGNRFGLTGSYPLDGQIFQLMNFGG